MANTTTPSQSGHGGDDNEGVLRIPPKLEDWSLAIKLFNVVSRTHVGGDLTLLQKCTQCILQPQLTGLNSG